MSVARGGTTLTGVDVKMLDYWMLDKKGYPNKWGKFRMDLCKMDEIINFDAG